MSSQPEHPFDLPLVARSTREIIERLVGHLDQMLLYEWRAFRGALLGRFDAALPFQNGPAVIAILRQLRKNAREINLTIPK